MKTASKWRQPPPGAVRRDPPDALDSKSARTSNVSEAPVRSRVPFKAPGYDVKAHYRLTLQIGLVLALAVVIALFRIPMRIDETFEVPLQAQEIVQLEEIQQTKQEVTAPLPPRPAVPIEVPNDEVIVDEELDLDVTLDLDEAIVDLTPPAPPEPEEKQEEVEAEIFVAVEEMPEIIGGTASLYALVKYPPMAQHAGLEGTVVVGLVVEPSGVPGEITVMKSVHPMLDEAAVEAVKQLRFKPGRQRGRPVRVRMAIPIRFELRK